MNNKEKSYYANITKHLNSVYKSVELDIDSICSILEHVGNGGKQTYNTKYYNQILLLPKIMLKEILQCIWMIGKMKLKMR